MQAYEVLEHIMQEKNITPSKLAIMCGLSVNGVKNIISGKKSPTIKTLMKICGALDVSPRVLFQDIKSMELYILHLFMNADKQSQYEAIHILHKGQKDDRMEKYPIPSHLI